METFNHDNAALKLCIDEVGGGQIAGLVYSRRLIHPMPFRDLAHLVVALEGLLDAQNFPQAFQRTRSFTHAQTQVALAAAGPDEGLSKAEVEAAQGRLHTLCLHVLSRRASSWQGEVDWLDGTPPQPFVSTLELLWLIDGRIGSAD